VTLGQRRVEVQRPRARAANGTGELPLRTYQQFTHREPPSRTVPEPILAGVYTRRYGRTQEPAGDERERAAGVQPQTDRHAPSSSDRDRPTRSATANAPEIHERALHHLSPHNHATS
jgi:hypothetical protein